MGVLRWMFTKEGSAATPRLSAASASLLAGVLASIFFSLRMGDGWGVVAGLGIAVVCFRVIYPSLREEHERQQAGLAFVEAASLRVRLRQARPGLMRLGVLFAALSVGVILALAVGSVWPLALVMVAAIVGVAVVRAVNGR